MERLLLDLIGRGMIVKRRLDGLVDHWSVVLVAAKWMKLIAVGVLLNPVLPSAVVL